MRITSHRESGLVTKLSRYCPEEVAVQLDDFPGAEIYGVEFDNPLGVLVGPKDQVVPIRTELHLNSTPSGCHGSAELGVGVIRRFQEART